ncbi:hypothetical protein [Rhizobium leguminosarum]|uniref:hypothetical protein n=1 Tax=Rhizobium leguminosarum TaxID=384 RepID=UPI003F952F34
MSEADFSPRYFVSTQRIYHTSLSADHVRLAHEAVRYLASLDLDRAHEANGQGFSKSDTRLGNSLAKWPTEIVIRHWAFGLIAVKLARKYRRQLPPRLLVDQPVQSPSTFDLGQFRRPLSPDARPQETRMKSVENRLTGAGTDVDPCIRLRQDSR